jgi:membrane glycosyltransferase
MAYVSSPLWLALLIASTLTAWEAAQSTHHFFAGGPVLFPSWPIDRAGDMLRLLAFTLGMLIVPKFLSVLLLMTHSKTAALYGGRAKLFLSALAELVFSALLAPIMMLLHTLFVLTTLLGSSVGWEAQNRDARGIPWAAALRAHKWHVFIGLVWGAAAYNFNEGFFWWMTPVLAGMVLSPLLTRWSSLHELGLKARRAKFFMTPEEASPPFELTRAAELANKPEPDKSQGILKILNDPQASALHAALIPDSAPSERIAIEVSLLYEKLSRLGPESLSRQEKTLLLSYPVKPLDQVLGDKS